MLHDREVERDRFGLLQVRVAVRVRVKVRVRVRVRVRVSGQWEGSGVGVAWPARSGHRSACGKRTP